MKQLSQLPALPHTMAWQLMAFGANSAQLCALASVDVQSLRPDQAMSKP